MLVWTRYRTMAADEVKPAENKPVTKSIGPLGVAPTPGAATAARIGKGTAFSIAAAGTSPTFTALAEVTDAKLPKVTASPVEIYRYDSPTLYAELIPSWLKGGDLELTLVYNKDNSTALRGYLNAACQCKVTYPDGTNGFTYQGVMTEMGEEVPLKDAMTSSFKFQVSGAPVSLS